MLTPFDDYPIHQTAAPITQPASGDPNHYDRYFFNGHDRDGEFYLGGAMGHYPNRDIIDAAFSVVHDGVEHSVFASGRMPRDRATEIGPIRIEVVEPLRVLRFVVEPNEHGLSADLVYRARTVAIEEPRATIERDAKLVMDVTRLTQWGTWEGEVRVGDTTLTVDPARTPGTRDRSWGVRGVGEQLKTNAPPGPPPQIFWLWAPLHFDDLCTHLALFERADGERWLESSLIVPMLTSPDAPTWGPDDGVEHLARTDYSLQWQKGRREMNEASLTVAPAQRQHDRRHLRALLHLPDARHRLLAPGVVPRLAPRRARGRWGSRSRSRTSSPRTRPACTSRPSAASA